MVFLLCSEQKNLLIFQCEHLYLPYCLPALSSTRVSALARQDNFCWFLRQPAPRVHSDTFQEAERNQTLTPTPPPFPDLGRRKSCNGVCTHPSLSSEHLQIIARACISLLKMLRDRGESKDTENRHCQWKKQNKMKFSGVWTDRSSPFPESLIARQYEQRASPSLTRTNPWWAWGSRGEFRSLTLLFTGACKSGCP